MTTFNPGHWSHRPDWLGPREDPREPRDINRETWQRCCMVVAFCMCFAGLAPPHLIPFAFAGLLFLAGIASVGVALLRGDRLSAQHLTGWDEAALLFVLGLGLRLWLGPIPVS
jgi:hypothetical protein